MTAGPLRLDGNEGPLTRTSSEPSDQRSTDVFRQFEYPHVASQRDLAVNTEPRLTNPAVTRRAAPRIRAKENHLPACGQARPNIKGGLDDRAIARVAEQSSGASDHLAIQTSPRRSSVRRVAAVESERRGKTAPNERGSLSVASPDASCRGRARSPAADRAPDPEEIEYQLAEHAARSLQPRRPEPARGGAFHPIMCPVGRYRSDVRNSICRGRNLGWRP